MTHTSLTPDDTSQKQTHYGLMIHASHKQGVLRDITTVMAEWNANIVSIHLEADEPIKDRSEDVDVYIEYEGTHDHNGLASALSALPTVKHIVQHTSFNYIFGTRVIIVGAGAQVAHVALGAVNEADRHNIRGERISIDTIPIVGEEALAMTVDAVARLPRAAILVLAGALMGGAITRAVIRVQESGIPVIALNMAGSVVDHADLVVTDPIQAGVFAVMHVSTKAKFDISRVRGRRF
jgi:energy-converting hydrogenase B subunit Q